MPVFPSLKTAWLWLAVLLAPAAVLAQACPPPPAAPTPAQQELWRQQPKDRGLLWSISKNGRRAWLYGTVHAGRPEWNIPGPAVASALRASDVLALELDPLDPAIQRQIAALLPTGAGRIPPALTERVRTQVAKVCLPASLIQAIHPIMLLTTAQVMDLRRVGVFADYGIDPMLSGLAHGAGKPVVSLETPQSQLQALLGKDLGVNADDLGDMLREMEDGSNQAVTLEMLDTWARGDLAHLVDYRRWCACLTTPSERATFKRVLDDRNGVLADGIDALFQQGRSVFAAVGALHMVGAGGVPAQLQARGYRVEFHQP